MRMLLAAVATGFALIAAVLAQSHGPAFEVASIKACKPGEVAPGVEARPAGSGKSAAASAAVNSPVTLALPCRPLRILIPMAYIDYAGGRETTIRRAPHLEGGPAWIKDDAYAITAKAEAAATPAMMRGPMLQSVLEDRFQLKVHHETRQGEVYELTVAKNGPRLRPALPGSCELLDPGQVRPSGPSPGGKPWCSTVRYVSSMKTMSGILDGTGVTLAEMAPYFSTGNVVPVIDKTGLQGRFDFHLEYLRAGGPPPEDPDPIHAAPPIGTAIQEQLGLKLTPAKGPVDVLVIDHVERPSGN